MRSILFALLLLTPVLLRADSSSASFEVTAIHCPYCALELERELRATGRYESVRWDAAHATLHVKAKSGETVSLEPLQEAFQKRQLVASKVTLSEE